MAKRDKEYEARMSGMIYACNLAETKGIDALKEEIRLRGITKIPLQMSSEKVNEVVSLISENIYTTFLTMSMMALEEAFGFKKVRMLRFKDAFDKFTKATYDMNWLGNHYVSLKDYAIYLRDECGIDISSDFVEINTKCQQVSDKNNPDYRMVELERLVAELTENGHEKAADYLLERFNDY